VFHHRCPQQTSYSLSAAQIDDDFWFAVVCFEESLHDLLNCMHSEPVATVDERIASHELGRKGLVIVRLIAEIEF
jgi:hypothetical protein